MLLQHQETWDRNPCLQSAEQQCVSGRDATTRLILHEVLFLWNPCQVQNCSPQNKSLEGVLQLDYPLLQEIPRTAVLVPTHPCTHAVALDGTQKSQPH